MTWSLLLMAAVVVLALLALLVSVQQIGKEIARLRSSIRKAGTAAVAADELRQHSAAITTEAIEQNFAERIGRLRVGRSQHGW